MSRHTERLGLSATCPTRHVRETTLISTAVSRQARHMPKLSRVLRTSACPRAAQCLLFWLVLSEAYLPVLRASGSLVVLAAASSRALHRVYHDS
eukprot:1361768-Rhodomonas_salina.1